MNKKIDSKKTIEKVLNRYLHNSEEFIYGFSDLSGLLPDRFGNYKQAILIGQKLDDSIIDSIESGPNIEYYGHYHDINKNLSMIANKITDELKSEGISAITMEPTVEDSELGSTYKETLRTDFSHKMAATRAGLGWIGKTDLFISKKFGPRIRLATILIDSEVTTNELPIEKSSCGSCRICVDNCPAGAASGELWNIDVDRDQFYNPFRCREKCRELSLKNFNKIISLCGICVSLCPVGKK